MKNQKSSQILIWPIDRLVEYMRNPRKNDSAVDRMCGSIREFGFKIPCLVRSNGEVIDGHLRLKAARRLQMASVPVLLCDEWTDAQVKAFRLMVNRSASWADWDEELLQRELEDLRSEKIDLTLTGFDLKEIDRYLLNEVVVEDSAPPPPLQPVSQAQGLSAGDDFLRIGNVGRRNLVDHFGRCSPACTPLLR
jgi:ParB-like chromosome segregation protein Spo0J